MAEFRSAGEFFDPNLRLTIPGRDGVERTYVIPSPDALTGAWAQRAFTVGVQFRVAPESVTPEEVAGLDLGDDEERDLFKRLLGDQYAAMEDDGVPWALIKHAGSTALIWAATNKDEAADFWNGGGEAGKAPNRETARAAARSTRKRGSASGTNPKSSRKPRAQKA